MGKRWSYLKGNWEGGTPGLIRLGPLETMEAEMFAYPGEWVSRPRLNDIRFGEGSWMDYDEISDREAMQLQREIQALYDRMAAEKEEG